jgi:hypothetical protein
LSFGCPEKEGASIVLKGTTRALPHIGSLLSDQQFIGDKFTMAEDIMIEVEFEERPGACGLQVELHEGPIALESFDVAE